MTTLTTEPASGTEQTGRVMRTPEIEPLTVPPEDRMPNVAALIVYLGDQLGVGGQLSTGVVVVLGVRIFGNVAAIRRHLFRA